MKFATKLGFTLALFLYAACEGPASELRQQTLRDAAIAAGVQPLEEIQIPTDPKKVAIGEKLFESTLLSLNSDMSCQTCHLDEFSSADGLPNAIGTDGRGKGQERLMSNGDIEPRNTLPLWGRGSKGFDTFFWDGKVRKKGDMVISQFGSDVPSSDPLVVAVHLPFVEIREMVKRDDLVKETFEHEKTSAAKAIFSTLTDRIKSDQDLGLELADINNIDVESIKFVHIAEAIAEFIRSNFAVTRTDFHDFVFADGTLSKEQIEGGLVFFGKGGCSACHSGTLFSDLEFHVIPFDQLGFGKNGFGVDYGRFNATQNVDDLYKFRTPPLINVTQTSPYTHSGSESDLQSTILKHVDPLAYYDGRKKTSIERREDLAKLSKFSEITWIGVSLSETDIDALESFLKSLEN